MDNGEQLELTPQSKKKPRRRTREEITKETEKTMLTFKGYQEELKLMPFFNEWRRKYEEAEKEKQSRQILFEIAYELLPRLKAITTKQLASTICVNFDLSWKSRLRMAINMAKSWEAQGKAIISTYKNTGHAYKILLKE
jgi:hypothetical protein